MANLILICGCPGSGKSTYLKNHINTTTTTIISRDEIRFSIVKPWEDYFSHEDEVVATLWSKVNEELAKGKDVAVDQTSLTPKARKYLIDHVKGYKELIAIWMDTPLETCLERNELRKGTRAYVPREQVRRMYYGFIYPSFDEGFDTIIEHNGTIDKVYRR